MEVWKAIEGTNGAYEVSNTGKVRSLNYLGHGTTKELKQHVDRGGYHSAYLYFDGKRKFMQVHRLVATAYIPNPECKEQVNHKDGNKANNHVDNLEWNTRLENSRHAVENGLWDKQINKFRERNKTLHKPIVCLNVQTLEVTRYESTMEACRQTGSRQVSTVAKRKQIQSKGFVFYYEEEYKKLTSEQREKDLEDSRKSYSLLGARRKRPILATNIATGEKTIYESIEDAKRGTGSNGVLQTLQGKHRYSKGYTFEYAD